MRDKKLSGDLGERYASDLLKEKGYKIIERNFHTNFGEIDIIAVQKDVLCFVEVKTRWSRKFGRPEEAVGPKKIKRIKKAGQYFALQNKNLPKKMRIDVVAIEVRDKKVRSAKIINVF